MRREKLTSRKIHALLKSGVVRAKALQKRIDKVFKLTEKNASLRLDARK